MMACGGWGRMLQLLALLIGANCNRRDPGLCPEAAAPRNALALPTVTVPGNMRQRDDTLPGLPRAGIPIVMPTSAACRNAQRPQPLNRRTAKAPHSPPNPNPTHQDQAFVCTC